MKVIYSNLMSNAKLSIKVERAEQGESIIKALVKTREHWTLVKVDKEEGMAGMFK